MNENFCEKKQEFKNEKNTKNKIILLVAGVIAGLCNGLFGGGGGMIVVPILTFALKKEQKRAHATAILIILPMAVVSGLLYAVFGNFRLDSGIPSCLGIIIGGIIGALALKKISNKRLCMIFSFVMLVAGVKMLFF